MLHYSMCQFKKVNCQKNIIFYGKNDEMQLTIYIARGNVELIIY